LTRRTRLAGLASLVTLAAQASASASLTVMVSIPPQVEVVERLGGDRVTVEVLIPPGKSPTTYEPSPRQLATLAQADLLITVGVPFERQVMRRISTVAPQLSLCSAADQRQHSHDPGPASDNPNGSTAHDHGPGPDPHFWLDPRAALAHAEMVFDCLCAVAPDECPRFRSGLESYRKELETADLEIARKLAPLVGETMLVFHPAFGHFAERYGLHQLAIEHDGKEPTAKSLAEVINRAKSLDIRVIFVQPQFAAPSVNAVANALGATIVKLDPLAPDLVANLQRIADAVAQGLGDGSGEKP
jgi:zinc transport system substrate-binding protein